ncbi:MAG: hypothetical protein Tsb0026_16000 [Sulfuricaulis sp.]
MYNANIAFKCFQENLQLFGNVQTQPEKYNLYNGLSNLAKAVSDLKSEVDRLRQDIDYLRRNS